MMPAAVEDESQYYGMPSQPYMKCYGSTGEKKGRRRNPEKEEERAKYNISLENVLEKRDCRTTLMIKNIPNKYNQHMLLSEIDEGHRRQYDFFYLPIDFAVCLAPQ